MFKHLPNILTIIRFLLIPFILYFVFAGNYLLAFIFFTISGITDIADGFIARKFNLISNFGKLMDPLADKLTQIASLFGVSTDYLLNSDTKDIDLSEVEMLFRTTSKGMTEEEQVVFKKELIEFMKARKKAFDES